MTIVGESNVRQIDPQLRDLLRRELQGALGPRSSSDLFWPSVGWSAAPEVGLLLLPLLSFWAWAKFFSFEGLGVVAIERLDDRFKLTEKSGRETVLDRRRLTLRTITLGDGRRMLVLLARRPGTWLKMLRIPLMLIESEPFSDNDQRHAWSEFLGVREQGWSVRAVTPAPP